MGQSKFDPLRFSKISSVTPEERERLITEAAYYRSQHRGFQAGFELQDWLAAETQVDAELSSRSPLRP